MPNLDGSRAFKHNFEQDRATTTPSILDHYIRRSSNSVFNSMTLLAFAKRYSMPREFSAEPNLRRKEVIVVIRTYYPPDPNGPHYKQYCRQKLMLHVSFRQITELLGEHATYAMAYATFFCIQQLYPLHLKVMCVDYKSKIMKTLQILKELK